MGPRLTKPQTLNPKLLNLKVLNPEPFKPLKMPGEVTSSCFFSSMRRGKMSWPTRFRVYVKNPKISTFFQRSFDNEFLTQGLKKVEKP